MVRRFDHWISTPSVHLPLKTLNINIRHYLLNYLAISIVGWKLSCRTLNMEFKHKNDNRSLINVDVGNSSWQYWYHFFLLGAPEIAVILYLNYTLLYFVPGTNNIKYYFENSNLSGGGGVFGLRFNVRDGPFLTRQQPFLTRQHYFKN